MSGTACHTEKGIGRRIFSIHQCGGVGFSQQQRVVSPSHNVATDGVLTIDETLKIDKNEICEFAFNTFDGSLRVIIPHAFNVGGILS